MKLHEKIIISTLLIVILFVVGVFAGYQSVYNPFTGKLDFVVDSVPTFSKLNFASNETPAYSWDRISNILNATSNLMINGSVGSNNKTWESFNNTLTIINGNFTFELLFAMNATGNRTFAFDFYSGASPNDTYRLARTEYNFTNTTVPYLQNFTIYNINLTANALYVWELDRISTNGTLYMNGTTNVVTGSNSSNGSFNFYYKMYYYNQSYSVFTNPTITTDNATTLVFNSNVTFNFAPSPCSNGYYVKQWNGSSATCSLIVVNATIGSAAGACSFGQLSMNDTNIFACNSTGGWKKVAIS